MVPRLAGATASYCTLPPCQALTSRRLPSNARNAYWVVMTSTHTRQEGPPVCKYRKVEGLGGPATGAARFPGIGPWSATSRLRLATTPLGLGKNCVWGLQMRAISLFCDKRNHNGPPRVSSSADRRYSRVLTFPLSPPCLSQDETSIFGSDIARGFARAGAGGLAVGRLSQRLVPALQQPFGLPHTARTTK